MTGKVAVQLGPTVIHRCEQCKCPVVKQSSTGRFLINGSGVAFDPLTGVVTGECPRCKSRYTYIMIAPP